MTGGNHDAPLCRLHLTLWMAIESPRTGVHSRCQHVALQTQQQFAHLIVSLGTNITQFLLKILLRPRLQAPVLIIDEDTTILDGRLLRRVILLIIQLRLLRHRHISKPIPRAHPNLLAHMQNAVCQSTGIAANDDQLIGVCHNLVALPFSLDDVNVFHRYPQHRGHRLHMLHRGQHHRARDRCRQLKGRPIRIHIQTRCTHTHIMRHLGLHPCHPFNILTQHHTHLLHQSHLILTHHNAALLQIDCPSRQETTQDAHPKYTRFFQFHTIINFFANLRTIFQLNKHFPIFLLITLEKTTFHPFLLQQIIV